MDNCKFFDRSLEYLFDNWIDLIAQVTEQLFASRRRQYRVTISCSKGHKES